MCAAANVAILCVQCGDGMSRISASQILGDCEVHALVNDNPVPMLIVSLDFVIRSANNAVADALNVKPDQIIGSGFSQWFVAPDAAQKFLQDVFCQKVVKGRELAICHEAGRRVAVSCDANICRSGDNAGMAFVVLRDASDVRHYAERLSFHTTRDPLTSVFNRVHIRKILGQCITEISNDDRSVYLMHVGLDHFDDINDAFGHYVGDQILQQLALRISNVLGYKCKIGRLGSDEFAIVTTSITKYADVNLLIDELLCVFDKAFFIEGQDVVVTCCVGVAWQSSSKQDADEILRNAATALHCAKRGGIGEVKYFTAEMGYAARRNMEINTAMHRAVSDMEFSLVFQPRFSVTKNAVIGVEALLRWESTLLGTVSPAEFIPVAESNGLIVQLGEWVLGQACASAARWRRSSGARVNIAVNISARQFLVSDIVTVVSQALKKYDLPASSLELEITESMLITDTRRVLSVLTDLKALGVKVAVDDFGTGYSSLSYLKKFPLDYLKIDRSFVVDVPGDHGSESIARGIIAMADSLGLQVIAEGVETMAQLEFLHNHGCDEMQGFLFAKPMDHEQMNELLMQEGAQHEYLSLSNARSRMV